MREEIKIHSNVVQTRKAVSGRVVTTPELLPATAVPARLSLTVTKLEEKALLPFSTEVHHSQLLGEKNKIKKIAEILERYLSFTNQIHRYLIIPFKVLLSPSEFL